MYSNSCVNNQNINIGKGQTQNLLQIMNISKSQTEYFFQNIKVTHPIFVPNNGSEPRLPADDGAFAVPHHTPMEVIVGQSLQPFVYPENLVVLIT